VVCCGVSDKGSAIYNGRIYRATLNAHLLALDAKPGKEVWKSKVAVEGRLLAHAGATDANGVM
jgi:alcohol dehydrogenase (cytochrome c)